MPSGLGFLGTNPILLHQLQETWQGLRGQGRGIGGHIPLAELAFHVGRSTRSLSRDLTAADLNWRDPVQDIPVSGRLRRYVQKARNARRRSPMMRVTATVIIWRAISKGCVA